jgi:hypothetical protein
LIFSARLCSEFLKLAGKFVFPQQFIKNIFLQSAQSLYTILLPVLFFLLAWSQAASSSASQA